MRRSPSLKSTSGAHCGLVSQRRSDCISHAPVNGLHRARIAYFPTVGHGRRYALNMTCAPLENLDQYDCVMIVTDHSDYDYPRIVRESKLVVDTRNATKGIDSPKIVRC